MNMTPHLHWRKSSYSNGAGGNCVEVAATQAQTLVRDSKDRQGAVLVFAPESWRAFVAAVVSDSLG